MNDEIIKDSPVKEKYEIMDNGQHILKPTTTKTKK